MKTLDPGHRSVTVAARIGVICAIGVICGCLYPVGACAIRGQNPLNPLPKSAEVVTPLEPIQLRLIKTERREVDLPTVLRLAKERNLKVAEAREKVGEASALVSGARAQFLPNFKLNAGVGRTLGNISSIAQIPNSRATLFLNPAHAAFDSQAKVYERRVSEADLRGAANESLLLATVQYFDLVEAQALVRVQEQAVEMARRLVSDTEALVEQGLAIRADTLTARAELADHEQNLREAQLRFRVASIALATTLNLDPEVTLFPADREVRQARRMTDGEPPEKLTLRALKNRPEVAAATHLRSAAHSQNKGAQWGLLLPSFGVEHWFGGFTGDRSTFYFVEWSLFDQLGQLFGSRTRAARANLRQAELRLEQTRDGVIAQTLAAREKTLTSVERIGAAREAVQQAEESLRVRQERLRNNVGILLEVLQAQAALTRARGNLVKAIVDYNRAETELLFAVGEIGTSQ